MPDLTADDFTEWFEALWQHPPFAWQKELTRRVLQDDDQSWPDCMALPTASGKTACLDIAVFTLAVQAGRPISDRHVRLPRRIFFVVDRRVIVDEAYDRACKLAGMLRDAEDGILKTTADQLRALAGGVGERASLTPITAHQLRGGMYRSEDWARSPIQPLIVCSTVDQIGSRLLFRGYGPSWKMWPVHAGLVGNDSLILLDEAHCAQPFLQTISAVQKYRSWAEQPLSNRFHTVVMSATPPEGSLDVFQDKSDEPTNPEHPLGRRQLARKPIQLRVATQAKGRDPEKIAAHLARELAQAATELSDGKPRAIVVFCNRVATARATYRLLAKDNGHVLLLTGRMRSLDKDDIIDRLAPLSSGNAGERHLDAPMFVVATQTLEVGADMDFDALVTECASLDALRQRFGRLNRTGRGIDAPGVIVIRADQTDDSVDDPVYGAAIGRTWHWLGTLDNPDFGIATLKEHLPHGSALVELNAPSAVAPVMLPAHVDCWAQTAPEPAPTPDVSLFLHGSERPSPFVQVCWRADLDLGASMPGTSEDQRREASLDILTQVPPLAAECLPVPLGVFRSWLAGEHSFDDSADVEGSADAGVEVEKDGAPSTTQRLAILWRGRDDCAVIGLNSEGTICKMDRDSYGKVVRVRPGDTLVIPANAPDSETLGDLGIGGAAPRFDRGDEAYRRLRAKPLLRLHPCIVATWPESEARRKLLDLLVDVKDLFDADPGALRRDVLASLELLPLDATPEWLHRTINELMSDGQWKPRLHPVAGIILQGVKQLRTSGESLNGIADEDDTSAYDTIRVSLTTHLRGVANYARRFAEGCSLAPDIVRAIERAGLLHDLGKADPRFQTLLNGGNPWLQGELLAKSGTMPHGRRSFERARDSAGYPRGGRHELLSLRLAESTADVPDDDGVINDLIFHLIASHHGRCRPFAPTIADASPCEVQLTLDGNEYVSSSDTELDRLDSGVSDRFWRLLRHYGWWGLAWLEAILRLADHRCSEAEQEVGE